MAAAAATATMDIDDILAEVTAGQQERGGGAGGTGGQSHAVLPAAETRDLHSLTRAWVNEKCAPELLAWPGALVERVLARVRAAIELVERQTGDPDPRVNFRLIVVQTELERFKYLLRSFVRTRLAKLDRHAPYYLSQPESSGQLSAYERQYASQHQALLGGHFGAAFLAAFPATLQRLDDTAGGISMVDGPDADGAVFVRALADTSASTSGPVAVPGTDIAFDMARGDVYVVRWSAVRHLVLDGLAELV